VQAQSVMLIPNASVIQAIEFAVNSHAHDHADGHALHSILCNCCFEIFPALYDQTASNADIRSPFFHHCFFHDFIGHHVSMIAGKSSLHAAINIHGVILSQLVTQTHQSKL